MGYLTQYERGYESWVNHLDCSCQDPEFQRGVKDAMFDFGESYNQLVAL